MSRTRLPSTHLERGEALSLLVLLGGALPLASWPNRPDRVPGHYDPKGTRWGVVGSSAGHTLIGAINPFSQLRNLPGLKKPVGNPSAQGRVSSVPWWFLPLGPVAPLVMIVGCFYLLNRELHGYSCVETQLG